MKEPKPSGSLETTALGRPLARLVLPGSGLVAAEIEVVYQPRATRLTRALLVLLVALLVAPVVFFIPPHVPWVLLALAGGGFLAWRAWRGEYFVSRFQGECPRCATALELKPGSRIGARHRLECYGCHRHPELVMDEPQD